jgi:hypothetical protein
MTIEFPGLDISSKDLYAGQQPIAGCDYPSPNKLSGFMHFEKTIRVTSRLGAGTTRFIEAL